VRLSLPVFASLLILVPSRLAAQDGAGARDRGRELLLEHRFRPDSADSIVVILEQHIIYWAELTGPGAPLFQPQRRRPRPAFLVPIASGAGDQTRRFEVYALQAGPHVVSLSGLPPGTTATLRLYRDVVETRRIAEKLDRELAVGVLVAGGFHSGYRLDPIGGADPHGGGDVEACILAQTARFGTCVGVGRQSFPDAGFVATWVFIEERVRLASSSFWGTRLTEFGVALRYSQGITVGPRSLNPGLLGVGLYVTQYIAIKGRRGGSRIFGAFQHNRLGLAPETELLDSNRFTTGIAWTP